MASVERVVTAARGCLGTAFCHQGRLPGVGLDCVGLLVVAFREAGFSVEDRVDYGARPDGVSLIAALEAHGASRVSDMRAGDVLVFRYDHQPQHVALATGGERMIHAFAVAQRVVETGIGEYWRRRLVGIWRVA